MKCPSCGSDGAYIGFSTTECVNMNCVHYSEKQVNEFFGVPKADEKAQFNPHNPLRKWFFETFGFAIPVRTGADGIVRLAAADLAAGMGAPPNKPIFEYIEEKWGLDAKTRIIDLYFNNDLKDQLKD